MALGRVMQAVVDIAGNIDPSLKRTINETTKQIKSLTAIPSIVTNLVKDSIKDVAGFYADIGAGVLKLSGEITKATFEAGKKLFDLGAEFDTAADAIRIGTGATGEALDSLVEDFDAVYAISTGSMEDAAKAIADYNTRLGLSGGELQWLSQQALAASEMLGEDLGSVIEESSQAFQQWGVDSADMSESMDYLFKVSQSTGVGFTDLMKTMQGSGFELQALGYSFEEAAAMVGQLDKAGVDTNEVLAAMSKSLGTMAKKGIDATKGIDDYYKKIKGAKTESQAAAIAAELFGTKAGPQMAKAIRSGALSASQLASELSAAEETIIGAAQATYDLSDWVGIAGKELQVALKPLSSSVFDGMNNFIDPLFDGLDALIPIINEAVEAAIPFVEDFLMGAADLLQELIPMIASMAAELLPVLTSLLSNLLPPLLDFMRQLIPPLMQVVSEVLPIIAGLLVEILPIAAQIIKALLPVLVDIIASLLPLVGPLLEVILQIVQDVLVPVLPIIMSLVQSLLPPLLQVITAMLPALKPLFAILVPIAEVLGTIFGWIAKILEFGANALSWVFGLFGGGNNTSGGGGGSTRGGGGGRAFAAGGFTDGISIAGEAGTEAVISFNPAYRRDNLSYWAQAGQMLGVSDYQSLNVLAGGSSRNVSYNLGGVNYAPVVHVTGADEGSVLRALRKAGPEFTDYLEDWLKRRGVGDYDDPETDGVF